MSQFSFKRQILLFSLLFTVSSYGKNNVYEAIIPELTKTINDVTAPTEQEKMLLNALAAHGASSTDFGSLKSEVVQALNSVKFFSGILPLYHRTCTKAGLIGLARQALLISDDIETLNKHSARLALFESDKELKQKLRFMLSLAQGAEDTFYTLFKDMSDQELALHKQAQDKLYYSAAAAQRLNENSALMGTGTRWSQIFLFGDIASNALCFFGPAAYVQLYNQSDFIESGLLKKAGKLTLQSCSVGFNTLINAPTHLKNLYQGIYDAIVENNPAAKDSFRAHATASILPGMYVGLAAMLVWAKYVAFKNAAELTCLIHDKQKDLISTAHLLRSMEQVSKAIKAHPQAYNCMQFEADKLAELFDTNSLQISTDLKNLVASLMSWSFQGSDAYIFSNYGKILATHHLLSRIKDQLIPYIEAIGSIDAYQSSATLFSEFKNHDRVHFCIPTFIQSETPVVHIQEYWHPLIDPNVVVTNSVMMDQNNPNLLITGPNAGGKTTSLMSLIINIIFAQAYGIAPSSSFSLTPFAKIHSYLDITTNLQEGLSLFAAEVDRAKKLKNSIMSCTNNEKAFTIIDEIFSGTAPDVASDVGFNFAQQLGNFNHSMAIITTHFPALTKLEEKTGKFINFKVADAVIQDNGAIVYPFKLVPGISSQNIAAQMLCNEGII